ncbi:MAG: PD40 domain-containing protein [Sedimentisphaerales bacterium]|nr:PD40 domain-containing protein [Sedimentisphaerales bacterium]
MRKIIYLMVFVVNLPCSWSAEKNAFFTGSITFIEHFQPQPTYVKKINLSTLETSEVIRGTDERPYIRFFRYSPDNSHFVFTMGSIEKEQADTELYIGDDSGKQFRRITENDVFEGYPAWSPNGKQIVFVRGIRRDSNRFWTIDIESMREQIVPEDNFKVHRWADWLPDNQRIIAAAIPDKNTSADSELRGLVEINIVQGTARWLHRDNAMILNTHFSHDRTKIAFIMQSPRRNYDWERELEYVNQVHVLDLITEKVKPIGKSPEAYEQDLIAAWAPDGKRLAWFRCNRKTQKFQVIIFDFGLERLHELDLSGEIPGNYSLIWSPQGNHIAYVTSRQKGSYTLSVISLSYDSIKDVLTSKIHMELLNWH